MNNNTAGYIALRSVILGLSACAILGLLLSSRVGFIAASMVMVIIVLVCAATLALVYYPSRIIRVSTLFVAMLFTRFLVSDIAELAAKWGGYCRLEYTSLHSGTNTIYVYTPSNVRPWQVRRQEQEQEQGLSSPP